MSADLQWAIIRKNSCFLVKSQGKTLTKEPNNLTGQNSYKYNGLVNKKTIGVEQAPSGKGVVLSVRKVKGAVRQPSKLYNKVNLSKDSRRSLKGIKSLCQKNYYRQDLMDAAVRRASLILRSQKPTAGVQKKRSRRKRN
ncbi:60S ribosomal protein L28 [Exaiptasia diaphana]|uniref:Large ribosomal subunit protein eL28 n=1 Tax=Exaiptasia diaphana TaxID=2652724 RepID=A0A913Y6Q7_EXADI|nr:60S ribosomal protein L28 [Exaiptasia diaphana]KXJ19712.1 60S ribosomal protein L28 [Exaiptasia diaphana]